MARLTAEQWAECLEYYHLEPFGPPVDDTRHGIQCAVIAAPHLPKGVKADPTNYMIRQPPKPEQTPEQQAALVRAAFGGGVRES